MGHEIYCDFCRKVVPAENLLRKIEIGGSLVGEACLNCASQLEIGLKKQVAEVSKAQNVRGVQTLEKPKVLNIPDAQAEKVEGEGV